MKTAQNSITIENVGPIDRAVIHLQPGRVTLLTGNNGIGKTEALGSINALAGRGTDSLKLRDGAERGSISGLGSKVTLTVKQTRRTGELDVLVVEEGFSLGNFVRPGFKAAEANDKARLKSLASCLGVVVTKEAVYDLVGGKEVYQELVSEKTVQARDPADYVGSLKRDMDTQALEVERIAEILEAEARTLEDGLPDAKDAESNEQVLSKRMADAMDAKRALIARADAAEQMRKQAEEARKLIAAGQGDTVDAAKVRLDGLVLAQSEVDGEIVSLQKLLEEARRSHAMLTMQIAAAADSVEAAERRAESLTKATEHLSAMSAGPTEAELAKADADVREAEHAIAIGHQLREVERTKSVIDEKRAKATAEREAGEKLRKAAKSALSLLVDPINQTATGIRVDEQMRLVLDGHRRGKPVYLDELSEGERVALAVRLMVRMAGGEEQPAIVALPQDFFESLDAVNRQKLVDEVGKTQLMVVVAEASRSGSLEHLDSRFLENCPA